MTAAGQLFLNFRKRVPIGSGGDFVGGRAREGRRGSGHSCDLCL